MAKAAMAPPLAEVVVGDLVVGAQVGGHNPL